MQFCITFLIDYYELTVPCCIENIGILIFWLLQKPADLDLHCFQLSLHLVSYSFKEFRHGIFKVRAKLSSLCNICSLGQVKLHYLLSQKPYLETKLI